MDATLLVAPFIALATGEGKRSQVGARPRNPRVRAIRPVNGHRGGRHRRGAWSV